MFGLFSTLVGQKRARSESSGDESDTSTAGSTSPADLKPIVSSIVVSPVKSVNPGNISLNTTVGGGVRSPLKNNRKSSTLSGYRSPQRNESIYEERVTLAQKLAQAVPDAEINSPHVVIVGGQTAGKTKLIISLVFYHLIDNESFTDDMGEHLLKLFRTGTRMVTRRPTTINFSKSRECQVKINLGRETAVYPSVEFGAIIARILDQSRDTEGHAYEEELRVYISAPGLPNRTFTDLPGLITKDRQLTGSTDNKSIATMVCEYMRNPTTTVVVVEPASVEDFETSQISPLLRDIRQSYRPDIFDHSVLVLSKCDKVRDGLETDIMEKIDLTSPQLAQFPYKHVVGVINKIEGAEDNDCENLTFAEFKQQFRETREYEHARFAQFLNRDMSPCDPASQCTTSAVFAKMEQISFQMVYKSIQDGLHSLDAKIVEVETTIKEQLAPPIEFYDHMVISDFGRHLASTTSTSLSQSDVMSVDGSSQISQTSPPNKNKGNKRNSKTNKTDKIDKTVDTDDNNNNNNSMSNSQSSTCNDNNNNSNNINNNSNNSTTSRNEVGYSRMTFIEEYRTNLDAYLALEYEKITTFADYGAKLEFVRDQLEGWPEHKYNSLIASKQHKNALKIIELYYHKWCEITVKNATEDVINNNVDGVLTKHASPFHRIDRFPLLCTRIKAATLRILNASLKTTKEKLSKYLQYQWEFIVPSGALSTHALCALFDTLHHVAIRTMHEEMCKVLDKKSCFGLEDCLFVECETFSVLRKELQDRPFQLRKQRDILTSCLRVRSNEELREVLEKVCGSSSKSVPATPQQVNNSNNNNNGQSVAASGKKLTAKAIAAAKLANSSAVTTAATSSATSTSVNDTSSTGTTDGSDRDHWRDFWVAASIEATLQAQEEADRAAEITAAAAEAQEIQRIIERNKLKQQKQSKQHSHFVNGARQMQVDDDESSSDDCRDDQSFSNGHNNNNHNNNHNTAVTRESSATRRTSPPTVLSDEMMMAAAEQIEEQILSQDSHSAMDYLGTPSASSRTNTAASTATTAAGTAAASAATAGGLFGANSAVPYASYAAVQLSGANANGWQQLPTAQSPSNLTTQLAGVDERAARYGGGAVDRSPQQQPYNSLDSFVGSSVNNSVNNSFNSGDHYGSGNTPNSNKRIKTETPQASPMMSMLRNAVGSAVDSVFGTNGHSAVDESSNLFTRRLPATITGNHMSHNIQRTPTSSTASTANGTISGSLGSRVVTNARISDSPVVDLTADDGNVMYNGNSSG